MASKLLLCLLRVLGKVGVVSVGAHPLDAAHDVAAGKEQARKDKLLHGVGVGTRGIEDDDALIGAAVERNVVHTGTGACNGEKTLGELGLVEARAPHHDGVGILEGIGELVLCPKAVSAGLGDVVHAVNLVHGMTP